jgi:hypothetical protein
MYSRIFEKYQAASSDNIMWFEPTQVPSSLIPLPIVFDAGFEVPPGGQKGSAKHILNEHTYCCELAPDVCAAGEPAAKDADRCKKWHDAKVGTREKNAEALGIPLFISEFGACIGSDPCITEINQVADANDKYLTSGWAYWQFKTFKDLTTTAGAGSEGFYDKDGTL